MVRHVFRAVACNTTGQTVTDRGARMRWLEPAGERGQVRQYDGAEDALVRNGCS
jgi:hypothetical protein